MKRIYALPFFILLFLFSCKKDEVVEKKIRLKDYYINNTLVSEFVTPPTNQTKQVLFFNGNKRVFDRGKATSTHTIKSEDGQNAFYIINYEKPGFIILSADKRTPSILAFSEEANFPTNETYPLGVANWLNETKEGIEMVRKENKLKELNDFDLMLNARLTLEDDTTDNPGPPERVCDGFYIEKQPLLSTRWGQTGGYNNFMPFISGVPYYNNGRAYTGCVATAMAQIIRYHEYPGGYNYSIMPEILSYTDVSIEAYSIASLMNDAAVSVFSTYHSTYTGAAPLSNAPIVDALHYIFSYSSTVTTANFSYSTVKNELNNNRPVLLTAYKDQLLINYNGHAWVTDGYLNYFTCTDPYNNHDGYETLLFHMNWGWDGLYNGWFGQWNPGTSNYQYGQKMVYGIKP